MTNSRYKIFNRFDESIKGEYLYEKNMLTEPDFTNNYKYDRSELPVYEPGAVVLLDRRLPFGSETTPFEYDRNYRLIYFYTDSFFNSLVDQEKYDEWVDYYEKKTTMILQVLSEPNQRKWHMSVL